MTLTNIDIKRLVPEFEFNGAPGQLYFYGLNINHGFGVMPYLLISTRAQLEKALTTLKEFGNEGAWNTNRNMWCKPVDPVRLIQDSLAEIEEMKK